MSELEARLIIEIDPNDLPDGPPGDPGIAGPKGDPFRPDEVGLAAGRGAFDAEAKGFAFLATDTAQVFYKLSATSGDWSDGIPFSGSGGGSPGKVLQIRPTVMIPAPGPSPTWPYFAQPAPMPTGNTLATPGTHAVETWHQTGASQTITRTDPSSTIRLRAKVIAGFAGGITYIPFIQFAFARGSTLLIPQGYDGLHGVRPPDGQSDAIYSGDLSYPDSGGGTGLLTYHVMVWFKHTGLYLGRRGADTLFKFPGVTLDVSEELVA
jgi:hypothetical protein